MVAGGAQLGDHPLRLAQRIGADQHAGIGIRGQAIEQLGHLLRDRGMAEQWQAEGRLGDEDVARGHFERRAGRVRAPLVVAGDHHPLAGMLEQDLRAAEHVAGGDESGAYITLQRDRLAIGNRGRAFAGLVAQVHDRQRLGRGDRLAMPAARVIGVAMRDQCVVDGARRIDPRIRGNDVDAPRFGPDP